MPYMKELLENKRLTTDDGIEIELLTERNEAYITIKQSNEETLQEVADEIDWEISEKFERSVILNSMLVTSGFANPTYMKISLTQEQLETLRNFFLPTQVNKEVAVHLKERQAALQLPAQPLPSATSESVDPSPDPLPLQNGCPQIT